MLIFLRIVAFLMGVISLWLTAGGVAVAGMMIFDGEPGHASGDINSKLMMFVGVVGVVTSLGYFVFAFFVKMLADMHEFIQSLAVLSLAPSMIVSTLGVLASYHSKSIFFTLLWFLVTLACILKMLTNKPHENSEDVTQDTSPLKTD